MLKLESKQQFATWIKNRIADYDFQENQDFIWVSQKNETQTLITPRGRETIRLLLGI